MPSHQFVDANNRVDSGRDDVREAQASHRLLQKTGSHDKVSVVRHSDQSVHVDVGIIEAFAWQLRDKIIISHHTDGRSHAALEHRSESSIASTWRAEGRNTDCDVGSPHRCTVHCHQGSQGAAKRVADQPNVHNARRRGDLTLDIFMHPLANRAERLLESHMDLREADIKLLGQSSHRPNQQRGLEPPDVGDHIPQALGALKGHHQPRCQRFSTLHSHYRAVAVELGVGHDAQQLNGRLQHGGQVVLTRCHRLLSNTASFRPVLRFNGRSTNTSGHRVRGPRRCGLARTDAAHLEWLRSLLHDGTNNHGTVQQHSQAGQRDAAQPTIFFRPHRPLRLHALAHGEALGNSLHPGLHIRNVTKQEPT
mmetsp:Transcript_16334/g.41745  ORF Transcript_16334/g.41745 Transcript_16334/m.41745 type:complete len:365 (-) Transcript_16334:1667-2761(-)